MRVPQDYSGAHTATTLLDHIASASPTVAVCVKAVPNTGSTIGITSTNADLSIGGVTYRAATGATISQLEASVNHPTNIEITTLLGSNGITEAELNSTKWEGARWELFLVNYEDTTMGRLILGFGRLGEIRVQTPLTAIAEGRGLGNAVNAQIGRTIAPLCDADFGDTRCGLNLVALGYVHTGKAITTVTSTTVFRVATLVGTGVDYFTNGKVEIETGSNAGLGAFEVKTFTSATGEFTLHRAVPYTLTTSDTVKATRGCLKRLSDCVGYNNVVNFRGFPYVPIEKAMRVAEG